MSTPERPEADKERVFVGTGLFWGFIAVLVVAVGVVVLAAQNPDPIRIRWLGLRFRTPLIVVVLVTALVTVILDQSIGLLWRRRRRRMLAERAELERLRAKERSQPGEPGSEPEERPET